MLMEKAEAAPVPAQEGAHRKSKAVIALQLHKRARNVRYDNRRNRRRPPSVMFVARRSGWEDVLPHRRMLPSKQPLPHRDAPVASCSRHWNSQDSLQKLVCCCEACGVVGDASRVVQA